MTITELRRTLEALEIQGLGDKEVQVYADGETWTPRAMWSEDSSMLVLLED